MKKRRVLLFLLVIILAAYFLGPSPNEPAYDPALPSLPQMSGALEAYVLSKEQKHKLKPNNEARIIWADPATKAKTHVALVYLHGFSASQREGFPVHMDFAEKFGCNLYLARLSDHGIDTTDAMYHLTADRLWKSAKEAYAIGKELGDEVIIMSTSTGGTLALKLAATYPEIKALINFSPNIEINDPAAFLLNKPWGLQLARLVFKGNTRTVPSDEDYRKYWYDTYRLESTVELQQLVNTAATKRTFGAVSCPVWNGFYYLDEDNQDPTVKVSAIKKMHEQLGTPEQLKVAVAFPYADTHVIPCDLMSKSVEEVIVAVEMFALEHLQMEKVNIGQIEMTPL